MSEHDWQPHPYADAPRLTPAQLAETDRLRELELGLADDTLSLCIGSFEGEYVRQLLDEAVEKTSADVKHIQTVLLEIMTTVPPRFRQYVCATVMGLVDQAGRRVYDV